MNLMRNLMRSSAQTLIKVKKNNFDIYIADRKATTCIIGKAFSTSAPLC